MQIVQSRRRFLTNIAFAGAAGLAGAGAAGLGGGRTSLAAEPPPEISSRSRPTQPNTALRGVALVSAILLLCTGPVPQASAQTQAPTFELLEATIPELQAALANKTVTSRDLVAMYLARIDAYDQRGPALNAISVTNPNALAEAATLDAERQAGTLRGPLHGIPIIVKDNYDTIGMQTAAGSLVLAGWVPPDDAALVQKLHAAGAIIIAKSNMHEFAYGITTVGSVRPDPQPVCVGPQPWRLQRRHRRCHRRQFRFGGHGQRYLRLDSHSLVIQ